MSPDSSSSSSSRGLTRFICQELLYEFVLGKLELERQTEVDDFLTTCQETRREMQQLKSGLKFTAQASKVQVSDELRAALLSFEPQWKKTLAAWTLWSSQRGWKALPYIFIVAVLALGLAVFKPWHLKVRQDVLLVEQVRTEPDIFSPPADIKIEQPAVEPKGAVSLDLTANGSAPLPAPVVETETPSPIENEASVGDRGWLTRGDLEIGEFDHNWPSIRDKIVALGGKVAGNVELGWLRQKGEAYFHFSLPESNQKELEIFLKTFGPVRFSREHHPRVMPDGQIRIILTVKDGNTHEGPSEAP